MTSEPGYSLRGRLAYQPIHKRPKLTLPGNARVAVWTIVNVENWSPLGAMPRTVLPPPMGQPLLPDVPNWAWHEYGMRVGFWRFVEVLAARRLKATFALNGTVIDLYREAWDRTKDAPLRAGRAAEATIGSVRMVVIADTDAEAEALAQPAYERWYASLEHQAHSFGFSALFLPATYEIARRRVGSLIAGTPDTVRGELARHVAESGVNYPLLQIAFGGLSHAHALRTLKFLASDVLPAVRKL